MITFKRVDHFHVCVSPERLEEAREFYAGVLGLKQIYRPDDLFSSAGYWFDIGDAQLHIGVEPALSRTIRHTAMEVADIKAARTHLEANGVEIVEEPVIPERERFAFIDPFGNRMELLQIL
ncbi:glyoxalase [Mucilaginibacter terrenus]|uniref:Glyoxalase n=1 Tax=Mucilaginibacter terrenus TaxID=2482727 RepID=A0A3E2NPW3_9SPHI|nr:VOC family protein [Mucilaginibacter terrenus]RFZ83017.1 glyoxalase [Mucilaginibacter terrenus]